uniref:Putative vacuolar protein sorting 37b n=1 Tax=Tabanus bromius TaxID=304241 RepID=A0A0K8TLS7_TABBR
MYQQFMNEAQASIANLSSDELKELLNDDDKLEERIDELLARLEEEKEAMLSENRAIAEENLSKEPVLVELKGKLNELSTQGKELCSVVQEKLVEIKSKSNNVNADTALALLQAAAAEIEEESENKVKKLLDNELSLEDFLEEFMPSRKTMHLRKLKAEKMTELLRQPKPQPPNRNSGYYPGSTGGLPYPSAGSVPYPLGPMPMPMPGISRPYF